jgi:hypothetical protein
MSRGVRSFVACEDRTPSGLFKFTLDAVKKAKNMPKFLGEGVT